MIEPLARLGYASKALIYAIVGTLAIAAALNRGGRVTDTSGALRVVLGQPFGRVLLLVLAIGLCGYAVWRLLDAIVDPDRHGTGFKGLASRIGNGVRGGIYGALGIEALNLFRGLGASSGQDAQLWTARLMNAPFGEWLVGVGGGIVAVYGLSQIAASAKGYERSVDVTCIPSRHRTLITRVARFGIAARGLIITVLGVFLIRAALQRDPSEAHGVRESTLELANAVEGRWMLALVAVGLLAYAVDQAVHARCRRIRPVL